MPEPVLPLYLFKNRVFSVATATMFIVGLAMFGGIIYLPLFLQVVGGRSATNAGLLLLPLILGHRVHGHRLGPRDQPHRAATRCSRSPGCW